MGGDRRINRRAFVRRWVRCGLRNPGSRRCWKKKERYLCDAEERERGDLVKWSSGIGGIRVSSVGLEVVGKGR